MLCHTADLGFLKEVPKGPDSQHSSFHQPEEGISCSHNKPCYALAAFQHPGLCLCPQGPLFWPGCTGKWGVGIPDLAAVSSLLNDSDALEGLALHNSHIQSLHGSGSVWSASEFRGRTSGKKLEGRQECWWRDPCTFNALTNIVQRDTQTRRTARGQWWPDSQRAAAGQPSPGLGSSRTASLASLPVGRWRRVQAREGTQWHEGGLWLCLAH